MAKIIGITGKAGSGKDTAARYLREYRPTQFRSIAFADPIRDAMRVIFGWDHSYFEHPKKNEVDERFGISPRKAMQTLGTEWGRNFINTDLWLILAGARAEPLLGAGFNVMVTDVRFENEAQWIRKNGGVVWHIDRKVEDATGGNAGHSSESGVKFVKGDVRINNNETLGYMYDVLDGLAVGLAEQEQREAEAAELQANVKAAQEQYLVDFPDGVHKEAVDA